MGRAEAGSSKALGNAIKAKGLGRLRWYCQICEKQCRDENGFQAHTRSEPHMRKMLAIGPKAGAAIAEFSNQFQKEFLSLLKTSHQTNRVRANAVYNEYIQDKHHVHMNATRWVSLNGFIMTMGKAGIVKVDEDEKGLWITWVDNSPKTLQRQAAAQKKDRAQMDGEERERAELEAQIARAKALEGEKKEEDVGLQKKEGEKIKLSFGLPEPAAEEPTTSASTAVPSDESALAQPEKPSISFGTISTPSAAPTSIIINPLKRPAPVNVFKQAKAAKSDSASDAASSVGGSKKAMSETERLMKEDLARKSMRGVGGGRGGGPGGPGGPGGYQGAGPRRTTDGGRRFVLQ